MSLPRLFLVVLSALVLWNSTALAERRVALVIGNSSYETVSALQNPTNDAQAIATSLGNLGFDVVTGIDLDQRGMQRALREFSEALVGSDVALFFYAGHGIQVSGDNYLIPVDAELKDETDLQFAAVNMNLILDQMEREPRVKLVFLDACRDNPFKEQLTRGMSRTRSNGRVEDGLAKIDVNSAGGTLIAFATDPGALALDGDPDQRHSPFTRALLDHIEEPGLEIHSMMIDVRSDVWESTRERQRPWSNSSLTGKFYFRTAEPEEPPVVLAVNKTSEAPPPLAPLAPGEKEIEDAPTPEPEPSVAPEPVDPEIELQLWRDASSGNTIEEYQVYLDAFPEGKFAALAASRIYRLKQEREKTTSSLASTSPAALDPELAALSPEEREARLELDRNERRELQRRLKYAGFDPGGADGVLGQRSRAAILSWQESISDPPTGYITEVQLERLKRETETAYQAYLSVVKERAQRPAVASTNPQPAPTAEPEREGSHLGAAFRKIGHGFRDIFR